MKRTLIRVTIAALITGFALFTTFTPVLAQSNWTWTNLSSMIAERQNRPVWANSYASPYWYFTDGQDLWSGGHVWKTDGSSMADITSDVRSAGLSRVDDIVSDGQTIFFLENVTPRNNSIRVIAYNGSFTNLTSHIQQDLSSHEGIVQIAGSDGVWAILTSNGRIILYTPASNTFHTIHAGITAQIPYIQNHVSTENGMHFTMTIQPLQHGWILADATNGINVQLSRIDTSGNVTPINNTGYPMTNLDAFASNGQTVIMAGVNASSPFVYTYNGNAFSNVSSQASVISNWKNTLIGYDGTSWLILKRKNLYRFNGTNFDSLGQTKDYFVTIANNNSGTFLLGGAVSTAGNPDPSYPLKLKLVKVQEPNVVDTHSKTDTNTASDSYGGGRTYTSDFGPTITTAGSPSTYTVSNGGTFDYHVTATDPSGIDHIDLYVNTVRIKTCHASTCDYSATYFTNGLSTRAVPIFAYAQNRNGNTTKTSWEKLTVNMSDASDTIEHSVGETTVAVGTRPLGIAYGGSYIWVSNYDSNTVSKIDPLTNTVVATIGVGAAPWGIAYGGSYIWVADSGSNSVSKIDLSTNKVVAMVVVGTGPKGVAFDGSHIWVTNSRMTNGEWNGSSNSVSKIDLSTNKVVATVVVGTGPEGVAFDGSHIWVANEGSNNVSEIDPLTNAVVATVAVGTSPMGVAFDGSHIWVANNSSNNVSKIDPLTNTVVATTTVGAWPEGITYDGSHIWVANIRSSDVYKIDPSTNKVVAKVLVGTSPIGVAFDGSHIWVANSSSSNVSKIDPSTNSNRANDNISVRGTLDPSGPILNWNTTATYHAHASASSGLSYIEIYVNDSFEHGCIFSRTASASTLNCDASIYTSNYSNGAQLTFNAIAMDNDGGIAWNNSKTVTIHDNKSTSSNTWISSNPDTTTLQSGQTVIFTANATNPIGIRSIQMYVNGNVQNTCNPDILIYGTATCSATIHGANYSNGTSVYVNARITDGNGNITWSQNRTYDITLKKSTNTETSTWIWSNPNVTQIAANQNVRFYVGAWNAAGIKDIKMYVNGVNSRSCDLGYIANGNQRCSALIQGANYQPGTSVYVNARITDGNGNITWSSARTYTISKTPTMMTTTTQPNLPIRFSMVSNHEDGFTNNETISFVATATNQDAIQRINIMVNGTLVKTCTHSNSCAYTGGPYNNRTSVSYGAKVIDNNGNSLWTGYKILIKK